MLGFTLLLLHAKTLEVGPGRQFETIESAVVAAKSGDRIEVFPQTGGYHDSAVRVTTPNLTIVGMDDTPVLIDGDGFDYSGVGKIPRAIFQIDPGANEVVLRNFELTGAHNKSYNGAGVRINGADGVKVSRCDIHGNDMGIMSAEDGPGQAQGQVIFECHVHHNGAAQDPGFNHNLYLGGASVLIEHCEVDHSITGHNLKSRAARTVVNNSYLHDAANREVDLVEDPSRKDPTGYASFFNTVIAKDPACTGNRNVLHFGAEKGRQPGVVWMVCCTLVSPFSSPVILLSDRDARAVLDDCVVVNSAEQHPTLFQAAGGAKSLTGHSNWLSSGYSTEGFLADRSGVEFANPFPKDFSLSAFSFEGYHLPPIKDAFVELTLPGKQAEAGRYDTGRFGAYWTSFRLGR
jgi:hypothetical protein